jgi:hypothetical protein
MNAARQLGDKVETVSALPMKTIYQTAALPDQERGEIVDMITDPQHPPVKEIAAKMSKVHFKLNGSRHDQRMARHEAAQKKKADEKAAKRSPAAMKAAEARGAKELKKRTAWEAAEALKLETLSAQAIGWVNTVGHELAAEILAAMKEHGSWRVEEVLAKALERSTQGEETAVPNVVALDQGQSNVVPDDELAELNLTNAAA